MWEIAQQTYYRWRQKYGDMAPEMARTLKALQKEDTQLKTLVADQDQDHVILKEAAKGDFQARAKSPRSGRGTSQTGAR
jgi:hypothetical protein